MYQRRILDRDLEPYFYDVVGDMMANGPFGVVNKDSPSMKDGNSTKFYLTPYSENTTVDDVDILLIEGKMGGTSSGEDSVVIFVTLYHIILIYRLAIVLILMLNVLTS